MKRRKWDAKTNAIVVLGGFISRQAGERDVSGLSDQPGPV